MPLKRIKQSEVQELREYLLCRQNGKCPLCGRSIELHEAALDHDHDTGHCRATLHRECNAMEGKFTNWIRRFGKDVDPELFLEGLKLYWRKDYKHLPLHYTHRSPEEKEIRVLKRRLKKAKRESTKEKLRDAIKQLKDNV